MELDTGFWYFVSFSIFVAAAAGPLKKIIFEALRDKSAEISKELTEAEALKVEAELFLAEAKQRQREAVEEVVKIKEHAEKEAVRIREQSMADIAEFVKAQKVHLESRIAQMEITAVKNIHDHMIEVAVDTAYDVVRKTLTPEKDQAFTAHELKKVKHLM